MKASLGILLDLFRGFKVPVKRVSVFVLTIFRCVVPADLRSRLVNATTIVVPEMFTDGVDQQEPVIVFGENRGVLVHQVPTKVIESPGGFRTVNRQ